MQVEVYFMRGVFMPSLAVLTFSAAAHAQLVVSSGDSAAALAAQLAPGVAFSNPIRSPSGNAVGRFSGGASVISLSQGVVLSTGNALDANGPNDDLPDEGTDMPGSPDNPDGTHPALVALLTPPSDPEEPPPSPAVILDAARLAFDFTCPPGSARVSVDFVFASDEYPAGLADGLGIFVDGANIATVPTTSTPVTVESIDDSDTPFLFNDNDPCPGSAWCASLEANGFSKKLKAQAAISAGVLHSLEIVVGDNEDPTYDSWVFLSSFSCHPHACGDGAVGPGEQCDDGNTQNGDCCSATCQNEPLSFSITPPASIAVDGQAFSSGTLMFETYKAHSETWGNERHPAPDLSSPLPSGAVNVSLGASATHLFNLAWDPDPLDAPQVIEINGRFFPGSGLPPAPFSTVVGPLRCPVGVFAYVPTALSRNPRLQRTQLVNLGPTTGAQDNTSLLVYEANRPRLIAVSSPAFDGNFNMTNGVDAPWFVAYDLEPPPPPQAAVPLLGRATPWLGGGLLGLAVMLLRRRSQRSSVPH